VNKDYRMVLFVSLIIHALPGHVNFFSETRASFFSL